MAERDQRWRRGRTRPTKVDHGDGGNPSRRRGRERQDAVTGLCRTMCARASRPIVPIYGANDWDYSYGQSTAETILRDTEFIVELSPSGGARPFSVIDGGWSNGTAAWPDMGKLADEIKQRTARPGIWIRPLEAPQDTAHDLLLPDARFGRRKTGLASSPTIRPSGGAGENSRQDARGDGMGLRDGEA